MRTFTTSSLLMFSLLTTTEETCGNTTDADGDGWYTCQSEGMGELCDCNDAVPYIHPYGNEASTSGDDDCDGVPEWGIEFEYYDADEGFYNPLKLDDETLLVGYANGSCTFTLDGQFLEFLRWPASIGGYCTAYQQIINSDGQLVLIGHRGFAPDGTGGPCFMVIDPTTRTPLLERFDLPQERQSSTAMVESPSGGYYVSGAVELSDGRTQGSLMKLSPLGDVVWTKSYGAPTSAMWEGYFNAMAQTSGGDLVMIGLNCELDPKGCKWVIRTDSSGVVKWTLSSDQLADVYLHASVAPDSRDGVVLIGTDSQANDNDLVINLGADSRVRWIWSGKSGGGSYDVMTHWDGSITTAAARTDPVTNLSMLTTNRITQDGETAWEDRLVGKHVGRAFGIITLPDGSYIITATTDYSEDLGYEYQNAIIMRLDAEANPPPFSVVEYP